MNLPKSKGTKLGIFIVVVVLAAIIGGRYIIHSFNFVSTNDVYIEGRIHSIASKIPGTVKLVNVKDNQIVKESDILMEIDPADYELEVAEARAGLNIREAVFEQAANDKDRTEALYKEEVLPKEKHENVLAAYNLAKAQVEAAETQFKIAQRNLEYTKIYAPSDGYITKKSVEIGNQIQPGQPLMAVVALDDIWVVANYKETQLKNVRPGQRVEVKVDTYRGKVFIGKVDSIMAGTGAAFSLFPPENALGNYVKVVQRIPVKIVLDKDTDRNHVLRLGMSCTSTIITQE